MFKSLCIRRYIHTCIHLQCLGHIGPVVSKSMSLSLQRPASLPLIEMETYRTCKLYVSTKPIELSVIETLRVYLSSDKYEYVEAASDLLKDIWR